MSNPNQGAATRARNIEIERRLTAGESGPALAKVYGITQPRVHQIARAVREARGDIARRPKPSALAQPARKAAPATAPEKPYAGPVAVVPGTQVAPRPFVLSPAMADLAKRARAAQDPIHSLAGIRERAA